MTTDEIRRIIERNKNDIAFIIGNGINRYPNNPNALSWDDLLIQLWERVSFQTLTIRPKGISVTEFFDILELENKQEINLKKEISNLMGEWEPLSQHLKIINCIKDLDSPILTTNYEESIARVFNYQQFKTEQEGFTDFYPWSTYHGTKQLDLHTDGIGICYIKGMIKYHRTIRLG